MLLPLCALGLLAGLDITSADDWPQWRGPERNGTSRETGLLQEWPKEGPPLRWAVTNIGAGYGAPAVVGDRLYLLANDDLENESVKALDVQDGRILWAARLGPVGNPKQQPNFPGARSTPTVDGDRLYALGSNGDLACLDKQDGAVRWRHHLRTDFGGKPGTWAYSESPLVDRNVVVCTPGGGDATLVAFKTSNGELLWKSALQEADEAAYASPIVVDIAGVRQYVQLLQKGLVGVDAATGKPLWRYGRAVSKFNANIPTPLAADNRIYVASAGTGAGAVQLKSAAGGITAEPLYFEAKLPTAIGGAVRVGDLLYGTTAQAMLCAEFGTGKVRWEERALGAASLCLADGRLYLHGENGEVALVEPSPEGYREKGRFTPPNAPKHAQPMEKAWAYPVVANGRLYIRDGSTLWCFDVRKAGAR